MALDQGMQVQQSAYPALQILLMIASTPTQDNSQDYKPNMLLTRHTQCCEHLTQRHYLYRIHIFLYTIHMIRLSIYIHKC